MRSLLSTSSRTSCPASRSIRSSESKHSSSPPRIRYRSCIAKMRISGRRRPRLPDARCFFLRAAHATVDAKQLSLFAAKHFCIMRRENKKVVFMRDDARRKPPLNMLLVGHACLPEAGSELGITWNWAWHLAARNRVWVVTHGAFRPGIERYLRDHPRPNLAFIWVGPL